MDATETLDLENLKPALIEEAEFISFRENIIYLKNTSSQYFLKLDQAEAKMLQELDGTKTISDILQAQLEKHGAGNFQKIFDLIIKLNANKFLQEDCAKEIRHELDVYQKESKLADQVKKFRSLFSLKLKNIAGPFDSKLLQTLAGALSSYLFLVLFGVFSLIQLFSSMSPKKFNIFQVYPVSPEAGEGAEFISYLLSILTLWFTFSLLISLKNLFSAHILSYHNCQAIRPHLKLHYGVLYLALELDDIVKAGPKVTGRLYAARIFFPFLFFFPLLELGKHIDQDALISLMQQVCLIVFFMSICPLYQSDLIRAILSIRQGAHNLQQITTFLRKKFVTGIFNFKTKVPQEDYYIFMSVLSLVWLYGFIQYFWGISNVSVLALLTTLIYSSGPVWGKALVALCLFLIVFPMVILVLGTFLIGILNLASVMRTPLRKATRLANEIGKKKVPAKEQIIQYLQEIPLFSLLNQDELRILCEHLHLRRFTKGRKIIMQGEKGTEFYNVVSGKVAVMIEDSSGLERTVDVLETGDSFGEIALVDDIPRTATVKALEATTVLELEKKYFDQFVLSAVGGKEKITDMIRLSHLILDTQIFSHLAPRQASSLVLKLHREVHQADEIIFKQGDEGNRFFIIEKGEVVIQRIEDGEVVWDKTLGKGDYFGEVALIKHIPRTASVITKTDSTLLYLSKQEFYDIIKYDIFTGIQFDNLATDRVQDLGKEVKALC